jgi:hypothetical protein
MARRELTVGCQEASATIIGLFALYIRLIVPYVRVKLVLRPAIAHNRRFCANLLGNVLWLDLG